MDSEGRLQLPKLTSVNYRSWSFTIKAVLAGKDLSQHIDKDVDDLIDARARELSELTPSPPPVPTIEGEEASPAISIATDVATAIVAKATKEIKLADAKAMAVIIVQLGTDQLSYVETATTAYQQWQALRDVYEPTGPAQLAALLSAFHSYSPRGVQVDKAASELSTIQADIRLIEPKEAPTDKAKLVTLTELLLRSNIQYESTVLMIRNTKDIKYGQAVLMLKQAEERIQATSGERSYTTELAHNARERPLSEKPRAKLAGRGRGSFGRRAGDNRPRGRPTGGNRECWHCGSQSHIRTACPAWLSTPEGTKWAAKNPAKQPRLGAGPGLAEGAWTVGSAISTITTNSRIWLVDSGATAHMTWDRSLFTTFTAIEPPNLVMVANGASTPCSGTGAVELRQSNAAIPSCITLQDVRYMPDLNTNLLSVSKLEDHGISIASRPGFLDLIRNSKVIATAQRRSNVYILELGSDNQRELVFAARDSSITSDILHARFAHVGDHAINGLKGITEGFQAPAQPKGTQKACDPCNQSKQVRVISRDPPVPATDPLGRVYIDGWGPYSVPALGFRDAQYFFTITCEATRKKWVRIVSRRVQFPAVFMELKAHLELQSGYKLKAARLDNAGENKTLGNELRQAGVAVEFTTAYTPSQNGVAERLNRTLVRMAKAMLLGSGLPQKFWGFAIEAACYIRNRLLIRPGKITPEQAFTGKKPRVDHLRVFGCLPMC
jgi:gag-polypeptide of LTR copia-type